MAEMGSCEFCGAHRPLVHVTYLQNTGMLVARQSKTVQGSFCKSCSFGLFWRMTLHNLVLGWWGMISALVTPFFILNNLYFGIQTALLPSVVAEARRSLEDQREYALNLLKGKDDATVIDVLVKQTGVPEPEVAAFVQKLRAELSKAA